MMETNSLPTRFTRLTDKYALTLISSLLSVFILVISSTPSYAVDEADPTLACICLCRQGGVGSCGYKGYYVKVKGKSCDTLNGKDCLVTCGLPPVTGPGNLLLCSPAPKPIPAGGANLNALEDLIYQALYGTTSQ